MSPEAHAFKDANDRSPVVVGAAIPREGGEPVPGNVWSGSYTLADGRTFRLPSEELRTLPDGYPRWEL